MIANDQKLQTTLERVAWFQQQVAQLRRTAANPVSYRATAAAAEPGAAADSGRIAGVS